MAQPEARPGPVWMGAGDEQGERPWPGKMASRPAKEVGSKQGGWGGLSIRGGLLTHSSVGIV